MSPVDDTVLCYVKVLTLQEETSKLGEIYKKVSVVQETGYWHERFTFNMFQNTPLFNSVDKNSKLCIKLIN